MCDGRGYFYVIEDSWVLRSTSARRFNLCTFEITAGEKKKKDRQDQEKTSNVQIRFVNRFKEYFFTLVQFQQEKLAGDAAE